MNVGKISFSLFTRSLEIVLYVVLQHEMGLKSAMNVAPRFFGTKVRIVAFVDRGMKQEMKTFDIACSTSDATIGQAELKKAEVKPSGPGDLRGLSFFSTFVISAGKGGVDIS